MVNLQKINSLFSKLNSSLEGLFLGWQKNSEKVLELDGQARANMEASVKKAEEQKRLSSTSLANINKKVDRVRNLSDFYAFVNKGILPKIDKSINFISSGLSINNTSEFFKSFTTNPKIRAVLEILEVTLFAFATEDEKLKALRGTYLKSMAISGNDLNLKNIKHIDTGIKLWQKAQLEFGSIGPKAMGLLNSYASAGGDSQEAVFSIPEFDVSYLPHGSIIDTFNSIAVATGSEATELASKAGKLKHDFGLTTTAQSKLLHTLYFDSHALKFPFDKFVEGVVSSGTASVTFGQTIKTSSAILRALSKRSLSGKQSLENLKSLGSVSTEYGLISLMKLLGENSSASQEYTSLVFKELNGKLNDQRDSREAKELKIRNNTKLSGKQKEKALSAIKKSILELQYENSLELMELHKKGNELSMKDFMYLQEALSNELMSFAKINKIHTSFDEDAWVVAANARGLDPALVLSMGKKGIESILASINAYYKSTEDLVSNKDFIKAFFTSAHKTGRSLIGFEENFSQLAENWKLKATTFLAGFKLDDVLELANYLKDMVTTMVTGKPPTKGLLGVEVISKKTKKFLESDLSIPVFSDNFFTEDKQQPFSGVMEVPTIGILGVSNLDSFKVPPLPELPPLVPQEVVKSVKSVENVGFKISEVPEPVLNSSANFLANYKNDKLSPFKVKNKIQAVNDTTVLSKEKAKLEADSLLNGDGVFGAG